MENLTTGAVLKDKLSSVASELATKATNAVQSLGSGKPTEENPISYKVVHRGGALVRSGFETTSGQVHQLSAGEVVTVVELIGRRARIVTPIDGWISIETKDGVQIMKQCALQRKSQQNEAFENAFERKFQKMKDKQNRSTLDPRAERSDSGSRSNSPRDRRNDRRREDSYDRHKEAYDPPPKGSRRRDDSYDKSRRRDDSRDRDYRDSRRDRDRDPEPKKKEEPKIVPKLAAPGSKIDAPVPKLAAPGIAPPSNITAGATSDMFNFNPSPSTGSNPPAPSGGMDLLDMGSTTASSQPVDFFASTPSTTPVLPVTGGQGNSSGDWNAFQSTAPPAQQQQAPQPQPYMNAFGGGPQAAMQPQMQNLMGNQMGGFAGAQPQPGWGGMGQAPMGMQAGNFGMQPGMQGGMQPGFQMGQNPMAPQAGYSAAFGGGVMGGMPGNMPGGMPGNMSFPQQQQQWGAFNAATGPSGGTTPVVGMPTGSTAPGNSIDDLLSKTMDGVANLSFEQRKQQSQGTGMPMQNMPLNMMQPRGF